MQKITDKYIKFQKQKMDSENHKIKNQATDDVSYYMKKDLKKSFFKINEYLQCLENQILMGIFFLALS